METSRIGTGVNVIRPPFHRRVMPFFIILAFSSIASNLKPPADETEYSGGTLVVVEGSPVLGIGNGIWSFEYTQSEKADQCWKKIVEVGDVDTQISALIPLENGLLIGTQKTGLWFFDGTDAVQETRDHLRIGEGKSVINALAEIAPQQILIGTISGVWAQEGKDSGLWTWDRSREGWDSTLTHGFPMAVDVNAIVIDSFSPSHTVYVGTRFGGIYMLGSDGWWSKMKGAPLQFNYYVLYHSNVQQIAISPFGSHILYAVAATIGAYEHTSGFFRFNPDRENAAWERVIGGKFSEDDNVWSVAADPSARSGVWAGSEKGLYYSPSTGDAWYQKIILPRPRKIQAILPFKDWLIVLTSDGVITATLSETRSGKTSSPNWIRYDGGDEERRCPITEPGTEPPVSATINNGFTITDTLVPTTPVPNGEGKRTPSLTPDKPHPEPTSPIGPIEQFWIWYSNNYWIIALSICAGTVISIAIIILYSRNKGKNQMPYSPQDRGYEKPLPKIPILFLAAEPINADHIRVEDEKEKIKALLRKSTLRDRYDLKDSQAVGPEKLTEALLTVNPKIVHFAGHGTESGEICLEEKNGKALPVSPEDLAYLFKQFAGQVECVIFNTCYASDQAVAIAKHIDFVIGVEKEIDNEAAIAFSTGFYQKLGEEYDIKKAYDFGCVQMRLQKIPKGYKPILKKRSKHKTI